VRLFQIEEPEGGPSDPEAPGAAIGIDISSGMAEVAMAVGGNAVILADRDGFERALPVPPAGAASAEWRDLFEGARLRAERALSRPVTHAVVVAAGPPDPANLTRLLAGAEAAGVAVLHIAAAGELAPATAPALTAAILAEDMTPRPVAEPC
jgi:hypothetical protein